MPPPPAARNRVLDALERLLVDRGERAATLEAVAREAAVSKGGLIYHFPSREAMVEGLLDRLQARADEDSSLMRDAPEGVVAYFLRTSQCADTPFDRTMVAATRLRSHASAREALARVQLQWYDAILADVGDETVAQMVMLMGDGFYYNASAPDALASTGTPQYQAKVDDMVALIGQLVRLRSGSG
ncbi:MAG TPA: helix-turn-helix domain-containing protein [Nakamurella sp.]